MRLRKSFVCGTAVAALVGSLGASTLLVSSASAGHSMPKGSTVVMTGPTGNKVEMVEPSNSTYVPRIARASAADRAEAQNLLNGVNDFCRTHSAKGLRGRWRAGMSNPSRPTHLFNPSSRSRGLHTAEPRAALVDNGKLVGVMFTGVPLPSLGSIPRAHSHNMSMPVEMVHVYCTHNLRDAFTPNRMLGVKADLEALRLKIRPAVMNLNGHQLHVVLHKVRDYAGSKLDPVSPSGTSANGGPDPALQAMRTEIRNSLMILSEAQLRSVDALMRSF